LKGFEGFLASSKGGGKWAMSYYIFYIYIYIYISICCNRRGHWDQQKHVFLCSLKRLRKFQPEDRLFSLSSVTSPAVFKFYFYEAVNYVLYC
jgi:hypothetical protein